MKTSIKILGGIAVLAIVAIMLLPSLIPADTLKKELVAQVEAATGKKLVISGALQARFFPVAGVLMEDISLVDPRAKKDEKPLLTMKSLDVRVALLPLLSKQVVISKLVMDTPNVFLHREISGNTNWQLAALDTNAAPATKNNAAAPASAKQVKLGNVNITDGTIEYRDDSAKSTWIFSKADLAVGLESLRAPLTITGSMLFNGKPVKVNAGADTLEGLMSGAESKLSLSANSELFELDVRGKSQRGSFSGEGKFSSSSLIALQRWVDPSAKPALQAPLATSINGTLDCTARACEFTKANFSLDALKAGGKVSLAFTGDVPNIEAEFVTDALDLTPFMPPAPKRQAGGGIFIAEAFAETSPVWSKEPMDFSLLKAFNGRVNVVAKSIRARNITIGESRLNARINNGKLAADVVGAQLYGGRGDFSVMLDANTNIVEKRATFAGIDAGEFLKDAMDEQRLSGKADIRINVVTQGSSEADMVSGLQGNGSIKLIDGAIRGINLADMVRNIQSAFKPVASGAQKTDFAEMGGTFTIVNGVIHNSDLSMKAPLMRLTGAGQIDLAARTINYRLRPEFVDTMQGQGGKDKQGITVPVAVTGSLDNPQFQPDAGAMIEEIAKDPQKIKDTVKSVKDQFKGDKKKKTLKDIRSILKGL